MTAQTLLSAVSKHWWAALMPAGLLVAFPAVDLWFSGLFFTPADQTWIERTPAMQFSRSGIPPLIIGSVVFFVFLYVSSKFTEEVIWGATGRRVAYLLTTLLLGPGLLVESLLKTQVGRARPRDTTIFGGTDVFTPAFWPADACARNCSFVSGHAALAFWVTAYAFLLPHPYRLHVLAGGVTLGLVMGFTRIMEGAHFLSDVVFAGLIVVTLNMWIAKRFDVSGDASAGRNGGRHGS